MGAPLHTQKLDLSQISQLLQWLDDEHRKDKVLLIELQKRLEDQKHLIIGQSRRIESLEIRLKDTQESLVRFDRLDAAIEGLVRQVRRFEEIDVRLNLLQTSLARFDQLDASIQQMRGEAAGLLPKFEHELSSALEQAATARAIERERDMRALNELRKVLEPIPEFERRLDALAAEDRRLNDQFPLIHKELERLAVAVESQMPRMQYLEEWGGRLTAQIAELRSIEERVKSEHAAMHETTRRSEEDLRQVLAEWQHEVLEHRRRVDQSIASLPPLDDLINETRRMLTKFEGLDDEIRGEQAQVAHMLELSEERVKELLTEYRSDYEKNWDQHFTVFDLYRKQQRDLSDSINARLEVLEQEDAEHEERWRALREAWAEQSKRQLLELERARQELEASMSKRKKKGI